jgi:hypothetical protein
MEKSENVFCFPDTLQNRYVPQSWQIFIMNSFLNNYKKKIQFYTGENHRGYRKMKIFSEKIKTKPKIHGFIFYSLIQFCYDKQPNIHLIEKAIKLDYTIYFAREKIKINKKNFCKKRKNLIFFKYTNQTIIKSIKEKFEK